MYFKQDVLYFVDEILKVTVKYIIFNESKNYHLKKRQSILLYKKKRFTNFIDKSTELIFLITVVMTPDQLYSCSKFMVTKCIPVECDYYTQCISKFDDDL